MPIGEDLYKILVHDSALPADRNPIGAVCEGEAVTLRLRSRDPQIAAAELVLFWDGGADTIKMQREAGGFVARTPKLKYAGVYFYYFVLRCYGWQFYYGANPERPTSTGTRSSTVPAAFQITVYRRDFETPSWFRKSVMYQIFPDRYARGDASIAERGVEYHRAMGRTIHVHTSTHERVDYSARKGMPYYYPNDFYGGTLDGIRRDLKRLKALGVGVIYLNPIFEADSNHRYNTSDYLRVDPILGTNEDLAALCDEAHRMGIRIMLDGVFSHTGSDSVYFNRDGRYPGEGAYQSESSPYYPWYNFSQFPDQYRSWWGFETLPEVDEHDPDWQDFVISGKNSVVRHWLRAGADGYRLDVADELPDDVLDGIRRVVKEENPKSVVLGEVWEDPTTKISYGLRRRYALGTSLDSVMNYPFRTGLLNFAIGEIDAHTLAGILSAQRLNYPRPFYYSLMNLLSSHDVERARSVLASGMYARELTREQQASFRISPEQDERGAKRQAMLAALQFTLPGVPCVYYGDEYGMAGFLDPFNRGFLDPEASAYPLELLYQDLAALRNDHPVLSTGEISIFALSSDVLCVVRATVGGQDVFGETAPDECFVTLVNRASTPKNLAVDILRPGCGMDDTARMALRHANYHFAHAQCGGQDARILDGIFTAEIAPLHTEIYRLSRE